MQRYLEFGKRLGAALFGVEPGLVKQAEGYDEVMSSPAAEPMNRELCKMAAAAFDATGEGHCAHAILFKNLAEVDEWHPGYDVFSDVVKRAMHKQALLPGVGAAAGGDVADFAKTLAAAGAIGGAGVGSLAFLLSRNALQSSSDNAEILERAKEYKRLTREIKEDMAHNQMLEPEDKEPSRYAL